MATATFSIEKLNEISDILDGAVNALHACDTIDGYQDGTHYVDTEPARRRAISDIMNAKRYLDNMITNSKAALAAARSDG